jgi:hypothetical protein
MTTALSIRKREMKLELDKEMIGVARGAGAGAKEIFIEMLRNPIFTLILANVAIEALQLIEINEWQSQPGTHAQMQVKRPLISQGLATTMETIINSTAVLTSLSTALGGAKGLTQIIGALK